MKNRFLILLFLCLITLVDYVYLHTTLYVSLIVLFVFVTFSSSNKIIYKMIGVTSYLCLLQIQSLIVASGINSWLRYFIALLLVILGYGIHCILLSKQGIDNILFYKPGEQISIKRVLHIKDKTLLFIKTIDDARLVFTKNNILEILYDLPRHNVLTYVNKDSIQDEYFKIARRSLQDPYIYIVLSDTGSAASSIIGVFTGDEYNHSSIAFDKKLETLVSYNGGQNVTPPGLNSETLQNLYRKESAKVVVYKLKVTKKQKECMIKRVESINKDGSSYNLAAFVVRKSFKTNIMVCSQFIYKLLEEAGATYFIKDEIGVKPTDFVELDTQNKLIYVGEIQLSNLFYKKEQLK